MDATLDQTDLDALMAMHRMGDIKDTSKAVSVAKKEIGYAGTMFQQGGGADSAVGDEQENRVTPRQVRIVMNDPNRMKPSPPNSAVQIDDDDDESVNVASQSSSRKPKGPRSRRALPSPPHAPVAPAAEPSGSSLFPQPASILKRDVVLHIPTPASRIPTYSNARISPSGL
jgi:hypothetical protein